MSNALSIRHTKEDEKARINAQSNAEIGRYWPGKAPKWLEDEDPERDLNEQTEEDGGEGVVASTAVAAPVVLKKVEDPRLARLAGNVAAPRVISRREVRELSDEEASDEEAHASAAVAEGNRFEEDEDDVTARREAMRQRLQARRNVEETEILAGMSDEDEEEEESESEEEEEDEFKERIMFKPKFISKSQRDTIKEREELELQQEEIAKKQKEKLDARRRETRDIVIQTLNQEKEAAKALKEGPKELNDVNTDDEEDPEGTYEAWRLRELNRIRRDRDERDALRAAEAERIKIKTMTDEEHAAYLRAHPKQVLRPAKKSWKFMQKYWHKGAFFQEGVDSHVGAQSSVDEIFLRDYSAPTGDDKLNIESLPKVMQVKNFGRRGQTKYTHLVDQDTTVRDEYYDLHRSTTRKKPSAADQTFSKPKKFVT